MTQHNFRLDELDNMMPWEREVYLGLLMNFLKEEEEEQKEETDSDRTGTESWRGTERKDRRDGGPDRIPRETDGRNGGHGENGHHEQENTGMAGCTRKTRDNRAAMLSRTGQ